MISDHHQIRTCVALALALAAVAAPAASARLDDNPPAAAAQTQIAPVADPSSPPAQTVKISQPNGFDWGDAGIGAATIVSLVLLLLGSTVYVTHRRTARLR
jgi:hypothetical protein